MFLYGHIFKQNANLINLALNQNFHLYDSLLLLTHTSRHVFQVNICSEYVTNRQNRQR